MNTLVSSVCLLAALACGCSKTQPEPTERPNATRAQAVPSAAANARAATPTSSGNDAGGAVRGSDPLNGNFSLEEATKGIDGKGPLLATIKTEKGQMECKLFDDKAPLTVANFVGLARGTRTWKDPASGEWVNRPAYDGTTFHRAVEKFMIQGGDPKGNGSGEPGYVFADENWDGASHDRAGLLCMANRGKNTNGAQFFITDGPAKYLDGGYTIFGECAPLEVISSITALPKRGESLIDPVKIESVTISRGAAK